MSPKNIFWENSDKEATLAVQHKLFFYFFGDILWREHVAFPSKIIIKISVLSTKNFFMYRRIFFVFLECMDTKRILWDLRKKGDMSSSQKSYQTRIIMIQIWQQIHLSVN
jgi:hypothetical protein